MPRLLLVDDNPSIHKIAETLLASSDVQLVSCGSGAQAMALVDQGDRFDVALLDTSMMGMDGWALLDALRAHNGTARMPVAMMAGVLDLVDPEQLRLAPIQGFLKKPVELRDLGERVKRLMETPVPPPPPPPVQPAVEDDLLLLGPEDLAAEEESQAPQAPQALDAEDVQELPRAFQEPEPLDLEELDLEGLQGLTFPAGAMPVLDVPEEPVPVAVSTQESIPEFLLADTLPEAPMEASLAFADQLPDLGPDLERPAAAGVPSNLLDLGEPIDWSDDSDAMVGMALNERAPAAFPAQAEPEVITLSDILDPPGTLPAPIAALEEEFPPAPIAALAEKPRPVIAAAAAPDPLAALLADPMLLDRLAKAVVARLGDQALRELAWEVMPELAARLRQETP